MLRQLVLWTALVAAALSPLVAQTPATITAVNPSQIALPGAAVTLQARVLDLGGLPVASQLVTFTTLGYGTITNPGVLTDASGVATATFVAPTFMGTFYAVATVSGSLSATFSIAVMTTTTTLASITPLVGSQTVAPGASITLQARVLSSSGLPVISQLVTFTATIGGSIANPSVYTDASGIASAIYIAPTTTGTYYVTATSGGLTATFYISVSTSTTPSTGVGMLIRSGNGQIVSFLSATTPRPLTVVVRDSSGVPVPGVYVTWQVTSGVAGLLETAKVTDSNGEAGVLATGTTASSPGIPYQQATITAYSSYGTVSFILTSLGMTIDQQPIGVVPQLLSPTTETPLVGRAGQTLPNAIQVLVYTSTSVPIPSVGLDVLTNQDPALGPVATCGNTNVLTDAAGFAKCDLLFGKKTGEGTLTVNVGSVLIRNFNFSVTAGDPSSIVVVSGDGQSGSPGQTLPQRLVAELRDSSGNVLEGVSVLWEWGVTDPAGARLGTPSQVSDSSGRVSAAVTLGTRPGDLVVRVRSANVPAVVATFTLKVVLPIAGMVKISGDNQIAVVSQAFGAPLVVEVRDAQARPVAGVTVAFAVSSGSATVGSASAVTGADGRASMTVQAGATAGSITVSATADGQSVSFTLTSRLPGPVLTASSFVNGASFRPGLVPGSITAIVGAGLAPGIQGCVGPGTVVGPLPTRVATVEVAFGATLAPILAVCNVSGQEQVIVQAPFDMAAGFTVLVKVTVGAGSSVVDRVPVVAALPGIFETTLDSLRYAVIVGADGRLITPSQRARKGEVVYMYATGLGPVLPLAATNVPGVPGQKVWYSVVAGIAARGVRVVSAEYAANLLGVYVIAIEVPADAPSGADVPLALGVVTAEGQAPIFAADSRIPIQ